MNAFPLSRPASAATPATTNPTAGAGTTAVERRFGHRYLAKVIGLYVLFSVLWIFVSDELLAIFIQDPSMTLWLGMAKGWLFILITTGSLYLLINRFFRALMAQNREIQVLNVDLERRVEERTAELEAQIAERQVAEVQLLGREEQLHSLNMDLERKVAERTAETLATQGAALDSERRFRTIFNTVSDGIIIQDPDSGEVLDVNDRFAEQWGGSREEVIAAGFAALLSDEPPYTRADAQEKMRRLRSEGPQTFEWLGRRRNGSTFWVEIRLSLSLIDGESRILALTHDISARKAAEQALRESEARYRTIVDNVVDAIFVLDMAGNFLAVNDHACQRYGYTREEFLQLQVTAINTPEEAVHVPARLAAIDRDGQVAFEAHYQDAQGRPHEVEVRASKILFNGHPAMLSVVRDVTERKQAQARIRYLAYYDALTGLPNRVMGLDHLEKHVAQALRHQRQLAVLHLDLDQFKHINDTYGHFLADTLLRDVGRRLSRQLRAEDTLCRLAADEFMLVLPEVVKERALADLASLCDRLLALFTEPFDLEGHQVYVGLSLGVALYPRDGTDGETLVRHADTALSAAKRAGRQTWRFFEPSMNDELRRFVHTRDALRAALARQEFVLHYQPQIALESGRVVGVEALIRWQRPGVGLVMPDAFIEVAEESGLIVPLGGWVLREACRQAAAWRAAGWPDLVVAVNLSAVQFRRGQIGAEVLAALEESGLAPAGLELELTESLLLQGEDEVLETVAQWKAQGLQLALDDFGTGYSSLTYLKRFQVDKIKIDRSFIANMAANDQDRVIVQTIIDMAQGLKLRTIAEGVDDPLVASQLRFMGCDEAQGYLYAQPLAAQDLEGWLRDRGDE